MMECSNKTIPQPDLSIQKNTEHFKNIIKTCSLSLECSLSWNTKENNFEVLHLKGIRWKLANTSVFCAEIVNKSLNVLTAQNKYI